MSPAAPEATNRASTTPRSDGVVRLPGRGGEVATATGRTPRDRCRPAGGFQMPAPGGKRSSTSPGGAEEPFGRGRRPIQQAPTREGEHAASSGGGGDGAGRDGGPRRLRLGQRPGRRRRPGGRRQPRDRGPGGASGRPGPVPGRGRRSGEGRLDRGGRAGAAGRPRQPDRPHGHRRPGG